MRTLSRGEFGSWCKERGLESNDCKRPQFCDTEHHSFLVRLPDRPSRVLALARSCFPRSDYDQGFRGATIWFRDWGIWTEADEQMGMRVITHMRAGLGENRDLMEAPGHVFFEKEFVDARAFWTWPMIIGWDAILFPEKSDYFVFGSHDEVVCFVAREKQTYNGLLKEFSDWNPEESEWYFC